MFKEFVISLIFIYVLYRLLKVNHIEIESNVNEKNYNIN